jgi:hypothetical protein
MALLAVSAVALVGLLVVVDLLAASAVAGLLAAVSAREGLLVVVDFVGVGVGAGGTRHLWLQLLVESASQPLGLPKNDPPTGLLEASGRGHHRMSAW